MTTDDNELCIICYEELTKAPTYSLPECNHRFHQQCINQWFRQGSQKCPLCNSRGSGMPTGSAYDAWSTKMYQYKILRAASRKKGASQKLIRAVGAIQKKELKVKEMKKELTAWKQKEITLDGETITVKEAIKKWKKLYGNMRTKVWQLRRAKQHLPGRLNMVPIILVQKRIID